MLPHESFLPRLIAYCIFSQKKKKSKALLPTFLTTIALGPLLPTQGFAGVTLIIIKQRTVLFRKGSLPSTRNQNDFHSRPIYTSEVSIVRDKEKAKHRNKEKVMRAFLP